MSNKILNWNEIRRVRVSRVLCFEGFPRETPKPALATSCSKSPRWWSWSLPPTLTAPAVAASPTSSLPSPCPLGSLPSQVPPSSPRRERSPHGSGPRSHSQCPDQGQAGESAPAMRPPAPLLRQGQHHLPGVGAVLAQPAGSSTTNRVGFGERREGHVEAGPGGVHRGAGLGHHRLSPQEGPRAGGRVQPQDRVVLAPVPSQGSGPHAPAGRPG